MAEVMENGNYASKGVAGAGLGLGIAGTAMSLLGNHLGGFGFGNGYGRNGGYGYGYEGAVCIDRPVSKETFELQQRVSRLEAEKALLTSEQNTEIKIADVYERVAKQALDLERAENQKWTDQFVWNARQDARIAVAESKIHQLMDMTGLYIEANRVTPQPMNRYNSWIPPVTETTPAQTT